MLTFIQQSGPFILIQGLLALVVLILVVVNLIRLALNHGVDAERLGAGIDAVLFWGCLTAVLGFLGQWNGLHRASNALLEMGLANPRAMVLGFGESLGTTVFGMFVLVGSGFLWFGLRATQRWRVEH